MKKQNISQKRDIFSIFFEEKRALFKSFWKIGGQLPPIPLSSIALINKNCGGRKKRREKSIFTLRLCLKFLSESNIDKVVFRICMKLESIHDSVFYILSIVLQYLYKIGHYTDWFICFTVVTKYFGPSYSTRNHLQ